MSIRRNILKDCRAKSHEEGMLRKVNKDLVKRAVTRIVLMMKILGHRVHFLAKCRAEEIRRKKLFASIRIFMFCKASLKRIGPSFEVRTQKHL